MLEKLVKESGISNRNKYNTGSINTVKNKTKLYSELTTTLASWQVTNFVTFLIQDKFTFDV